LSVSSLLADFDRFVGTISRRMHVYYLVRNFHTVNAKYNIMDRLKIIYKIHKMDKILFMNYNLVK